MGRGSFQKKGIEHLSYKYVLRFSSSILPATAHTAPGTRDEFCSRQYKIYFSAVQDICKSWCSVNHRYAMNLFIHLLHMGNERIALKNQHCLNICVIFGRRNIAIITCWLKVFHFQKKTLIDVYCPCLRPRNVLEVNSCTAIVVLV